MKPTLRSFLRIATRLAASMAASVLVVGLLLRLVSSLGGGAVDAASVLHGVRKALPLFIGVYVLCQFAQTLLRACRSRVLLRASCPAGTDVPALGHLALVTFVRNACADMLPARLGELSYVAMLNRGYAVPAADCLSSLSIGLLFDFVALLLVLGVAAPAAANGLSLLGSIILLAVVCAAGWFCLFVLLPLCARLAARLRGGCALFRWKPVDALFGLFLDAAESIGKVRHGGVMLPVVLSSVGIRAAKYTGLYCLFVAVTRPLWPGLSHASVFTVLTALIAAEGAASLPVPTFLSFGSYEAGGLAALTALGFPAADSMAAMFAMHILSQVVDYSLGGLAYLAFTWVSRKSPKSEVQGPKSGTSPSTLHSQLSTPDSRVWLLFLLSGACFVLALAFTAMQYRAILKRGSLTPPACGEPVPVTAEDAAARDAALAGFAGRVVWSSNRAGLHDLYLMELPGGDVRRLTSSDFTDTYPRFSPDGTKIAFSRSTERWVSQRNFDKWDTWVFDLATGKERLVATNAYQACWSGPDSLVFVRAGGTQLVQAPLNGGPETTLLQTGIPPLGDGVLVTLPDARLLGDPSLAITLRGKRKATAHVRLADGIKVREPQILEIAGGCQMVWRNLQPFDGSYAWIDHPGRLKNALYTMDETGKPAALFDAQEPWSHEYFPRFADNGRWLVYGASTGGHEQDSEDYEIFLLDTSRSPLVPARLTFHTGNDCWPDVFAP